MPGCAVTRRGRGGTRPGGSWPDRGGCGWILRPRPAPRSADPAGPADTPGCAVTRRGRGGTRPGPPHPAHRVRWPRPIPVPVTACCAPVRPPDDGTEATAQMYPPGNSRRTIRLDLVLTGAGDGRGQRRGGDGSHRKHDPAPAPPAHTTCRLKPCSRSFGADDTFLALPDTLRQKPRLDAADLLWPLVWASEANDLDSSERRRTSDRRPGRRSPRSSFRRGAGRSAWWRPRRRRGGAGRRPNRR